MAKSLEPSYDTVMVPGQQKAEMSPPAARQTVSANPLIENLLLAVLAVNNWSLERVFELRDPLRDAGLFDLAVVSNLSEAEIARRLTIAGYARGEYMTTLMALRFLSVTQVLSTDQLARLAAAIQAGHRDAAEAILNRIRGVGPAVLRNFWILQGVG